MTNDAGHAFLAKKMAGIEALHKGTADFINKYDINPASGSQAESELHAPDVPVARESAVVVTFNQGNLLIEVAADHLIALSRSLFEEVLTFAPWTCLRAIIESSALACWLLDPNETIVNRIARGYALRYENLSQQRATANLRGDATGTAKVDAQMDKVEREAATLGYPPVRNRKGKRAGLGMKMLDLTVIVAKVINEEDLYRATSAVIHGNATAVLELGMQENKSTSLKIGNVPLQGYEKNLTPQAVAFIYERAAVSFARPSWYRTSLFGWNEAEFGSILDKAFNMLEIAKDQRFWKTK